MDAKLKGVQAMKRASHRTQPSVSTTKYLASISSCHDAFDVIFSSDDRETRPAQCHGCLPETEPSEGLEDSDGVGQTSQVVVLQVQLVDRRAIS